MLLDIGNDVNSNKNKVPKRTKVTWFAMDRSTVNLRAVKMEYLTGRITPLSRAKRQDSASPILRYEGWSFWKTISVKMDYIFTTTGV